MQSHNISYMTFDNMYNKYKYSIISKCKTMKKPSINNYIKYLKLYYFKIISFIEYHKQYKNTTNRLPDIDYNFLDILHYKLVNLDELSDGIFYYSPYDIVTNYNEFNIRNINKDTLQYVVLGSSWINFKFVLLWYITLCKLGYNSGL